MKILYVACFSLLTMGTTLSGSVIKDLRSQIASMSEGEIISMKYAFVGCFGPYHKGDFTFTMKSDSIYYHSKSFDNESGKAINQSGKYAKSHLLKLLEKAKDQSASEILGNSIHYQLYDQKNKMINKGYDYIDQRHFIELFHPFSTFLNQGNLKKIGFGRKSIKTPGINGN